jgi:hypothetical protein
MNLHTYALINMGYTRICLSDLQNLGEDQKIDKKVDCYEYV